MYKIALISDELTEACLSAQADIFQVTPENYRQLFRTETLDFLFVESAWKGYENSWKYKIASYKKSLRHPSTFFRNNRKLSKVVNEAKYRGLPTIFWNKEDDVHFDRFIKSAELFDHVVTVDENSVRKYKSIKDFTSVSVLPFFVQDKYHFFEGFNFSKKRGNFVGSYSSHIHDKRRQWQEVFLQASRQHLGLDIYDRNSDRKSSNYRYPDIDNVNIFPCIPHAQTAQVYKDYVVSFNVNTITDSETMYSRRLVEIMACGGMAVSNPSRAIDHLFKDYCFTFSDQHELTELLYRIEKFGHSKEDLMRMRAGASHVAENYTWKQGVEQIASILL